MYSSILFFPSPLTHGGKFSYIAMLKINTITSLIAANTNKVFIAYSGGIDSHVLLHLAALNKELKAKITAVYVHHGLQIEADEWAEHCQHIAQELGVGFKCLTVKVQKTTAQSLEELARDARYQAFESLMESNDVVLLAQHREDQMETVLLQLFRGAGVQGLSAMPLTISFGKGQMCRPFLDVSKQEINDYALAHQLCWIEDPSNQSDEFDRNFLRNQIVPQLKQKWPALDKTIARSARHCGNAQRLTEDLAKQLLTQVCDKTGQTLNISQLLELERIKQNLVIREWFKVNNLRMPAEKILNAILDEVVNAEQSKNPEIRGLGYCIRRYRKKLYCLTSTDTNKQLCEQLWTIPEKQLILADGSKLVISESSTGIPQRLWDAAEVTIKFRQGAEKISLPGRAGRHTLKKLYQEKGVPPWQRSNIPLIYLDNNLAAVADLWIAADYFDQNESCYQLDWLKPVDSERI